VTSPSNDQLIGKYIAMRNYVDAQEAELKARLKPYADAMETIENHFVGVLAEQAKSDPEGKSSIATPMGTVFRKRYVSIKVSDREAWMDFIFDGRREGFITAHVAKDAVTEYIEQFKAVPPGLDVTPGFNVQFTSPRQKKD
jgi:hypothetical protein